MSLLNVERKDGVATVTLAHEPVNALSIPLLQELYGVFTDLETDKEIKVILLGGKGRFFSAGADIKEFLNYNSEMDFISHATFGKRLCEKIENFTKPVIALIHGAALGAGLELALACHIRLVTKNAKLGLPEAEIGIIPGFAGTQRLTRFVGEGRALEMMLTGRPIIGEEAVSYQLANYACFDEDLYEKGRDLAQYISKKSLVSIQKILELQHYTRPSRHKEGIDKETESFCSIFKTHDAQEGIKAFIEHRKPEFQDR